MPAPLSNAPVTSDMSHQAVVTREEDEEVKPYVVVAEIGKGSFATVYKGFHQVRCNDGTLYSIYPEHGLSVGHPQTGCDQNSQQKQADNKVV
jgi:hypothetical protein